MEQMVTMHIPRQWLVGTAADETTLQQIFRLGLQKYRVEKALALYRDGVGSLGYVAEKIGIPKRELIIEARLRGIEPDFSLETVREELGM